VLSDGQTAAAPISESGLTLVRDCTKLLEGGVFSGPNQSNWLSVAASTPDANVPYSSRSRYWYSSTRYIGSN
jgi:hypothetical protein